MHHRTVSGAPRESDSELASFGNPLHYNSPDCSVSHRTMSGDRCDSGATTTSCQRSTAKRIQCATVRARVRAATDDAPDSLQDLSGAPPDSPEAPQVRAPTVEPQQSADVAGAPDCPVRHATAAFQQPYFGGWGYKYPNHPTFIGIQVFHLPTTYKSSSIQF